MVGGKVKVNLLSDWISSTPSGPSRTTTKYGFLTYICQVFLRFTDLLSTLDPSIGACWPVCLVVLYSGKS